MGSLEDAMKKAGLASASTDDAADSTAAAKESPKEANGGEKRPPREPRPPKADAEPLVEKPCAKCSTPFMPKHSKHRLCPKCAEEAFNASKEKSAEKGASSAGEKSGDRPAGERPAGDRAPRPPRDKAAVAGSGAGANAGPRPERRDRPARPPRQERTDRPQGDRPQGDRPQQEHREHRENRNAPKEAPQGFPRDYLQSGYFAGAVLRDDVFDTWARHVAGLLVSRNLSTNQMRAFYAHVRRAEASEKAGRDFKEVREDILKMRPVAAARLGRKLIPAEFADFLDRNLDQVKDVRSLHAFAEHFQAVVGYTAGRLKK